MNTRLSLAALLAGLLLAPATRATDLIQSYEAALKIDPELLAAEQALIAGREKSVQGDALLLPRINLEASLLQVENESETGLPAAFSDLIKSDSEGTVREAELQLVQPLYDASSWAERRQLQEQTTLAAIQYRAAQQDLIERVGQTYFDVLRAQESLRVVLSEKAAMQMQRDRAQARFEVGRGKITDLQEAQARYDAVLTREVSARNTLAIRNAQYAELTGLNPEGLAMLAADTGLPPAPADEIGSWQARALVQHPRILAEQSELAVAQAEIDKYRLTGRPTLDLVASYDWQGQDGGLSPAIAAERSETAVIGLQLSVPLFAGGALESREREALAKERQAQQDLAAARRDTRLKVQNSFLTLHADLARVHSLAQSVASDRTALQATTLGRDLGTRTELDVLDAQHRLYASELEWIEARYEALMDQIHLLSAAGELQAQHLHRLNAPLVSAPQS